MSEHAFLHHGYLPLLQNRSVALALDRLGGYFKIYNGASPVDRTESGYRQYDEADIHTLRFIKRARDLGFSMGEIAELSGLWRDRGRTSASVKTIAQRHLAELDQRIAAMQAMRKTLTHLVHSCHGDQRPDCPIRELNRVADTIDRQQREHAPERHVPRRVDDAQPKLTLRARRRRAMPRDSWWCGRARRPRLKIASCAICRC